MKLRNLFPAFLSGLIAACSSTPKLTDTQAMRAEPDVVLNRIDGLSERAPWVKESEPFVIRDSKVIATGTATLPPNGRLEAGYRVCENDGRAQLGKSISIKLDAVFQAVDSGITGEEQRIENMSTESMQLASSELKLGSRYWEKVQTSTSSGDRVVQYRIFCQVWMDESAYRRSIADAIAKAKGKGTISEELAKRANAQLDRVIANDDSK